MKTLCYLAYSLTITYMMQKYQNLPLVQLQARLGQITPIIVLLTEVWNNPTLAASITAAWEIGSDDPENRHVRVTTFDIDIEDGNFNELLQFIHNYCTNLCAEKHVLEFLIDQKKS